MTYLMSDNNEDKLDEVLNKKGSEKSVTEEFNNQKYKSTLKKYIESGKISNKNLIKYVPMIY